MAIHRRRSPSPPPRRRGRRRGFTLIELMIAVAVVALLASIAYPTYLSQIAKGRRADGKQALMELALRLERYYAERGTYVGATLGTTGVYPALSPSGHYGLAITTLSTDSFAVAATPRGAHAGDACATLGYNHLGVPSVSGAATLALDRCW